MTSTTPNHDSHSLVGRAALVTGAGTGIGAATAIALARSGAHVTLVGRRRDRLEAVVAEITTAGNGSGTPTVVTADVSDADRFTESITSVRSQVGAFDLVVANAGAMLAAPFETAHTGEWDRMVTTNISGVLTTARATIDDLLTAAGEGRPADLVLISSIGAHITLPGYAVYTATKAAVTHLTTNLRAEYGPRGVRVRAVEPGMTATDLGTDMADPGAREFLASFIEQNPPIPASAIAESIRWSASLPANVNVASMIVLPTTQG